MINEKESAVGNGGGGIDIVIEPRKRDLGGFSVGRVLPYAKRRMVGPFIFFDEIGPAEFRPGEGIDVRPHPHIGLATVTYLFEGEMRHRDNLGCDQVIKPGDVNWMTAGRGIVHSERTDEEPRRTGQRMHGIQSWVALPDADAETDPSFHHHPKASLPVIERAGVSMRLIAGDAFGAHAPVKVYSRMFYLGVEAEDGATIPLPEDHDERAIYVLTGAVNVDGATHDSRRMLVFAKGAQPNIAAIGNVRAMLLGGDNLGPRIIWWNLVASSQARIDKAKEDWLHASQSGFKSGVFTLPPAEQEFIPLPET